MRFVDDEEMALAALEELVGEDRGGLSTRAAGRHADLSSDHVDESEGTGAAVGEVVDGEPGFLHLGGELPEQDALSASALRDERADDLELGAEVEAAECLFEAAVPEEGAFGGAAPEGMMTESEVAEQLAHRSFSLS